MELIARMNCTSLPNCEPGRIAIAIPFQAGRVIALVFGISQRLGFGSSQFRVVTSFLTVLAGREIALVF